MNDANAQENARPPGNCSRAEPPCGGFQPSTATPWARQIAARAWCSDRTQHKVMDSALCEAFAEVLDQVQVDLVASPPPAVAKHQPDFKPEAWKDMSFIELATWVEQLTKRAARRANDEKRDKDLYDASNYLAMLQAKFEGAKAELQS